MSIWKAPSADNWQSLLDDAFGQYPFVGDGPSRLDRSQSELYRNEAEEQLDPRLTCLLFSKWAAGNQAVLKADDALALQSIRSGQAPTAVPTRAQSMPNPELTDEALPPLQSAFQACAGEGWPEDDVPSAASPTEEDEQPPSIAKALYRTQPTTNKNPKKWEELREKRRRSNRDSAKRVKLRREHKFAELTQEILQLRQDKEGLQLELKDVVHQRDAMARRIPDFVKRCKVIVADNVRLQTALWASVALPGQTKSLHPDAAASSAALPLPFRHSQAFPRPPSTPEGLTRPVSLMKRQASQDVDMIRADKFIWPEIDIPGVASTATDSDVLMPILPSVTEGLLFSSEQQDADFASLLNLPFN